MSDLYWLALPIGVLVGSFLVGYIMAAGHLPPIPRIPRIPRISQPYLKVSERHHHVVVHLNPPSWLHWLIHLIHLVRK